MCRKDCVMNEVISNIISRRSIRKFSDKKIDKSILEELVLTGLHAPSGMGKKTWKFTVVTNEEAIKKLCQVVGDVLGRDGYNMYNPVALIIPSNEKESAWGKEDNACALENIFLAANSYGIGSVWINQLHGICDNKEVRAVLDEFGIPSNHIVYGIAALGYKADDFVVSEKQVVGETAFIE